MSNDFLGDVFEAVAQRAQGPDEVPPSPPSPSPPSHSPPSHLQSGNGGAS